MSDGFRFARWLTVALACTTLALVGCGSDDDGDGDGGAGASGGAGGAGGGAADEPSCEAYCGQLGDNCTGDLAVYASPAICMAACAGFPVGDIADVSGNTLGCRQYHSGAAAGDPATHCPHAGPGGAGYCGADCESFCALAAAHCPGAYEDEPTCMTACADYASTPPFNANVKTGDTVECRLYHVSVAAVDDMHCGHIGTDPPAGTCIDE
jgi:hypothetical protein